MKCWFERPLKKNLYFFNVVSSGIKEPAEAKKQKKKKSVPLMPRYLRLRLTVSEIKRNVSV